MKNINWGPLIAFTLIITVSVIIKINFNGPIIDTKTASPTYAPQSVVNSPEAVLIQGDNNNVNTPAKYDYEYSISTNQNKDWPYKVNIVLTADKNIHLPGELCIDLDTDASFRPASKIILFDYNKKMYQTSSGNEHVSCISSPSSKLGASLLLNKNPSRFAVKISY